MRLQQGVALLMVYLTACAGVPRVQYPAADSAEAEQAAVHYDLYECTATSGPSEPVEVSPDDFQRAMRVLARDIEPPTQPAETARWLMQGGLEASLLAEVEHGKVARLTPQEEGSPLEAETAAVVARKYGEWCAREYEAGDCLGLFADGPTLQREDLRTLALAMSLGNVLRDTRRALRGMVSPQAVLALIIWTSAFYLALWLLPEPTSKLLASGLTLAMLVWLPAQTLWSLMDGWALLVHEVDRANSFAQIEKASEKFSGVMGENTARVLVAVVTAALGGGGAKFTARLPKVPGFQQAAVAAEAQGLGLAEVGEVVEAAVAEEGTFTLMVRRPGGQAAAAESAEVSGTMIIRHQGGNRQVFLDGKRWHVPANKSIKDIPAKDAVGDQLQEAAQRVAGTWNRSSSLSRAQIEAIKNARDAGKYLEAHLMERRFRGQWVESALRDQFRQLRWSKTGVDAVDPATGLHYEVLTGTKSNMELHGRRMAEEFFRLITF
jgi:hypothetical protein